MPRFFNPYVYPNNNNVEQNNEVNNMNNMNNMQGYNQCCEQPEMMPKMGCGCGKDCPTIYKECPPIVTCSKQVLNQYHITKQPYIHNYHTEVVHHHITQNEFIPTYTCSNVHVNEPDNSFPRFNNN